MKSAQQPAVTAFCPGHISGYFRKIEGENPSSTGSIGAGIVIGEGVTSTISPSPDTSVRIHRMEGNGAVSVIADNSPPIESVMERLGVTALVVTECRLPIGAGFGLSAAAILSTCAALNEGFCLGLEQHEIFRLAHETEVRHRTGLGDVAACQGGGRVVRLGPGIDGAIERSWDIEGEIHAISFGPIHTPTVLGSPEKMESVRAAFPTTVPRTAAEFFSTARNFAEMSGLVTPEVARVFAECDRRGVQASMTMLGNGVFAAGPGALDALAMFGTVYSFEVARRGVYIIGEQR